MHKNKKPKARNPVIRAMLAMPKRGNKIQTSYHKANSVRYTRKGARDVHKIEQ